MNARANDPDPNAGSDPTSIGIPNGPSPVSPDDIVPMEKLDLAKRQKARELMGRLDVRDTHSIISFGVEAQRQLTASADRMLEGVRNKDAGTIGEALGDLMRDVRGLGINDLKSGELPNWFSRTILRNVHPIVRFMQRYDTVQHQIAGVVVKLEQHKGRLVRDVTMLDKMYAASLSYFSALELYIIAAREKLREIDEELLPELKAKVDETGDMLDAQALRDTTSRRDDLERRIHDLRLTRQVTMQSFPQIRMIQDVDKSLLSKIQSSVLTTIPVWKSQIAMAIALWNQQEVLRVQKTVTDTTNQMLARNAELLRTGTAAARKEIERGIFDIETVRKVNDDLIATIRESLQIMEEGKLKRASAEAEMERLEADLRYVLLDTNDPA